MKTFKYFYAISLAFRGMSSTKGKDNLFGRTIKLASWSEMTLLYLRIFKFYFCDAMTTVILNWYQAGQSHWPDPPLRSLCLGCWGNRSELLPPEEDCGWEASEPASDYHEQTDPTQRLSSPWCGQKYRSHLPTSAGNNSTERDQG